MPSAITRGPALPKWDRPSPTSDKLDWADIKVIDLSNFDAPGEKQRLAEELRNAVSCFAHQTSKRLALIGAPGTHNRLLQRDWHWLHSGRG